MYDCTSITSTRQHFSVVDASDLMYAADLMYASDLMYALFAHVDNRRCIRCRLGRLETSFHLEVGACTSCSIDGTVSAHQ